MLTAQELSFRVCWKFPNKLLTMKIIVTYSQTNGLTRPVLPLRKDSLSLCLDLTYAKRSIGQIRLDFELMPCLYFNYTFDLLIGKMWIIL